MNHKTVSLKREKLVMYSKNSEFHSREPVQVIQRVPCPLGGTSVLVMDRFGTEFYALDHQLTPHEDNINFNY